MIVKSSEESQNVNSEEKPCEQRRNSRSGGGVGGALLGVQKVKLCSGHPNRDATWERWEKPESRQESSGVREGYDSLEKRVPCFLTAFKGS